jgi:hypothetical protein
MKATSVSLSALQSLYHFAAPALSRSDVGTNASKADVVHDGSRVNGSCAT